MNVYPSLDRRRLTKHYLIESRAPTALELLEASKKLYVQTEFLKQNQVDPNGPRLFQTESEEELNQLYQNALRLSSNFPQPSNTQTLSLRLRDQTNRTMFCPVKTCHSSVKPQHPFLSHRSAFQPVQKIPPRPPKQEAIKKRQVELASCSTWEASSKTATQPLPSYEELFLKPADDSALKHKDKRPVPPPRRSLLKTNGQIKKKQEKEPPVAMPRRQTTTFFGEIPSLMSQSTYIDSGSNQRVKSQSTSTTNLLAKSTPDLSLELLINSTAVAPAQNPSFTSPTQLSSNSTEMPGKISDSLARPLRSHSHLADSAKPPRPPTNSARMKRSVSNHVCRQSSSSFPSPNSSKDSGISTTSEINNTFQISSDADFEERVQRWERRKTIALPSKALRPINEKSVELIPSADLVQDHSSTENVVQELFNPQDFNNYLLNEVQASSSADELREDSDMASDFTSITTERKQIREVDENSTPKQPLLSLPSAEKPISQLEKNARVLRWIHGCSLATTTNC